MQQGGRRSNQALNPTLRLTLLPCASTVCCIASHRFQSAWKSSSDGTGCARMASFSASLHRYSCVDQQPGMSASNDS